MLNAKTPTTNRTNELVKSDRPILWVSKDDLTDAEAVLSTHFQVLTPENPVQSSLYQIIALQSERDIRRLIPQIQAQDPEAEVKVYQLETSIACFLTFQGQPFAGLMMGSIDPEQWLKSRADEPLELQEALAIAGDILATKKSQTPANIELDVLRRRCNVSSFDWNRYIKDLEAEIHAAVDGKVIDPDERLRLDLQVLLKETDPIKSMRKRAEIASHYRLKSSDIDKALKCLDDRSKTNQPRRMGLDELFNLPIGAIEYVIPGMLPLGETALLVASPKAGKSLLAYDAAFAVATGEADFLGEQVKQGKVLIIQCDESVNTARGRLIKRGFRHEDTENVQFVDSFKITQLDLLEEWLESFRPTLVVIDSLRRISVGRDLSENSAEFADAVYQLKELIARYNAAAILIHHSGKNQEAVGVDRVRGSSAISGAVWGVWHLDHILKTDPKNKKRKTIDPKDPNRILSIFARDVEGQKLLVEFDPENNHWLNHGEEGIEESEINSRKTNEDKILSLLKPIAPTGLEASELNETLNLGRGIYSYLNRLLAKGVIGSRPSTKDRRRTVYFYPKNELGDTPPSLPPTPTDHVVIEYAESFNEQELKGDRKIDRKIDRKLIAKNTSDRLLDTSKPEQIDTLEVDHKNLSQGGERGSTEVAINSVDKQEEWVKAVHPKSREWTAALYLGRNKNGHEIRFLGESAIVVSAKNVRFDC
jgi:AAA domain